MKLKCSNKIYHENKDLWDDHDDIMKLIKKFNVNKERPKEKIKSKKEDDPSEEIFSIDKMLKSCEIKVQKSKQETSKSKVCKYHSYGSCKCGSSCHFVHYLQNPKRMQ